MMHSRESLLPARRCLWFGCLLLLSQQAVLASEPVTESRSGARQEQAAPQTLESLLRQAVQSHPSVLAQRGQQRAAQAEHESAQWGRYPTLAAEVSQGGRSGQGSLARLSQPLWTGGRITGQIDSAQAGVAVARAAIAETELNVLQVAGCSRPCRSRSSSRTRPSRPGRRWSN